MNCPDNPFADLPYTLFLPSGQRSGQLDGAARELRACCRIADWSDRITPWRWPLGEQPPFHRRRADSRVTPQRIEHRAMSLPSTAPICCQPDLILAKNCCAMATSVKDGQPRYDLIPRAHRAALHRRRNQYVREASATEQDLNYAAMWLSATGNTPLPRVKSRAPLLRTPSIAGRAAVIYDLATPFHGLLFAVSHMGLDASYLSQ